MTVLQNADTTLSSAKPDFYILDYPTCIFRKSSGAGSSDTGAQFPESAAFPTFRYEVLINGIQYDEPLVIKDLDALKKIEETAARNGQNGGEPKAAYVNTASARGTSASATIKIGVVNDFMPIDKTSETWLEMTDSTRTKLNDAVIGGQTVRDTPDGINSEDIVRYVMKYRVVLNKGKERLNEGNLMTAEDEYSSNLSVDFNSIRITTEPEEAASKVSYDYSGNIGYFTIPDETKVVIEYEATVLQTAAGVVGVSNEVRMMQYHKGLEDFVDHGGAGGSTAPNPSILVKKYGSGHMEKGLNGAVFQLFEYKHASYTRGDSNTGADWEPVILTIPTEHDAVFETRNLTVGETAYGDGYAEIELRQDTDGKTLEAGKVYGLREIQTPVSSAGNGDRVNYQNPHKEIPSGGQSAVYMPILVQAQDTAPPALDPRFTGIAYDQVSGGWDINGLTAGDYLLVEYGNDVIQDAHLDWNWQGSYAWDNGSEGSFTNSAYTVYDGNGENGQTMRGVAFTVTAQEIRDGESKVITLTNAYSRETVTLTAAKQWTEPSGSPVSWPTGKTVVFTLGTLDENGQFAAVSGISPVTLDNKKDGNGEDLPGYAG